MRKLRVNKKIIRAIALAFFITTLYVFYLSELKPVQTLRLKVTDLLYVLRYKLKALPEEVNKIVILAIDDASIRELNVKWPWPRKILADAVKQISAEGPSVICVDLNFTEEGADEAGDTMLADAFQKSGNAVIASGFTEGGEYLVPNKLLRTSSLGFGFVKKVQDADKITRRFAPVALSGDETVIDYSLALKSACVFWGVPFENISYKRGVVTVKKNDKVYASMLLRSDKTIWGDYIAKEEDFHVIPIWKAVKGRVEHGILKDKIVFIGISAEVLHDVYYTPFKVLHGVFMNANETLMYLSKGFIKDMPIFLQYILMFSFVLITLMSVFMLDIDKSGFVFAAEIAAFLLISLYLFLTDIMLDFFGGIFLLSATFLGYYVYENISLLLQNARLKNEAVRDGLTKFYIFKFFDLKLKSEFEKAIKENRNLALLIVDLDNFKSINDTYGHAQGNVVLTSVADAMRRRSRRDDILARFTGTSFCAYMADVGFHAALRYAEHLRKEVGNLEFVTTGGAILKITVSAGIATLRSFHPTNYKDLIKAADAALFRAKNTGKNKICLYDKNLDII